MAGRQTIERCRLVPDVDQLPDAATLGRYGRVYLGNEYCEWRLPSASDVARVLGTGTPVTLLTPLATRVGLRRIEARVGAATAGGAPCEVVANDFGVLEMLRGRPGVTVIAGRLLTRNFVEFADGTLTFTALASFDFLADRYAVTRYELSNFHRKLVPGIAPELAARLRLSLYYPYQHVAITRQCLFRFRDVPADRRVDQVGCDQSCRDRQFRFEYPGKVREPFYVKGNTMFVCFDDFPYDAGELRGLGVDRLVHSVDLPL